MAFRLSHTLRLTGVRQMASGLGELGSGSIRVSGSNNKQSVRYRASGTGEFGSGAGKGGGTGGSIRDAGGSFGKLEAGNEEIYFRRLQVLQLKKLKEHVENEVDEHEKSIREHQITHSKAQPAVDDQFISFAKEAIDRHKKQIQKIQQHEKDLIQTR